MYELTTSEGVTILSVLARSEEVQRSEPDHLGLPASTFYATRRKIYDAGWLTDRYLPNPWASGFSSVDFALVRPPLGERSRVEREWASSPDAVLLWSGLNALFGVFFRRNGHAPTAEETSPVSITATRGSVPVYFDYSLAWSRFIKGITE